jgi:hypothetical protein
MSNHNNTFSGYSTPTKPSDTPLAQPKTFKARIRWLFTKEGRPALIAVVVGVILGAFVNGAIGIILATIVGLLVLKFFGKFPIPIKPWQALLKSVLPIVAKLSFLMVFFLPIADYLTMPSGHTPDTLMKYLSIMFVKPENFISLAPRDVFPGIPIIVLISIVLMFWGSLNLEKKKNLLFAFLGLLLYTFSPTIASASSGDVRLRFVLEFFAVGFYLAWVGLALIIVHKFVLPRILKTPPSSPLPPQKMPLLMSIAPVFTLMFFLNQLSGLNFTLSFVTLEAGLSFEAAHHMFASVFIGGIAGVGAGAIVTEIPEASETELPEEPPATEGPQPSTDPEDPPGTTIEHNPDGTTVKRLADGTVGTLYTDGTKYVELPDGSKYTEYPDGTKKMWTPDGHTETEYPDGSSLIEETDGRIANISPDGTNVTKLPGGGSVTHYPDGRLTDTNADGSSETWDKDGKVIGKTLGSSAGICEGFSSSIKPDGSFSVTSPYGGSMDCDADRNPISGSITCKDGTNITFNPDGSQNIIGPNGDKVTVAEDGSIDAKLNDGTKIKLNSDGSASYSSPDGSNINIDGEGKIQGTGHLVLSDGRTVDINPDKTIVVKAPNGDSATLNPDGSAIFNGFDGAKIQINKDGSGTMNDAEGNIMGQNSDGSGFCKATDGRVWTANSDGSSDFKAPDGGSAHFNNDGTGSFRDSDGSTASLNKDGSATVTDPGGKSTTYTKEQLHANSHELAHQSDNIFRN